MPEYRCANCLQPGEPRLEEVGLSPSCCSEAILLVPDESRAPLFARELAMDVDQAWRSNMPYDEMHVRYNSPSSGCECDACDRGREWERHELILDEESPNWDVPPLRTLDTSEELSLAYDLAMEADAARSPAERARQRILGGP